MICGVYIWNRSSNFVIWGINIEKGKIECLMPPLFPAPHKSPDLWAPYLLVSTEPKKIFSIWYVGWYASMVRVRTATYQNSSPQNDQTSEGEQSSSIFGIWLLPRKKDRTKRRKANHKTTRTKAPPPVPEEEEEEVYKHIP